MDERDLLQMVKELHRMGYERVRIEPALAPSGCFWRCRIAPSRVMTRNHGARIDSARKADYETARYSSSTGRQFFGWTDAEQTTPRELAGMFIERFPKLAQLGKGPDPEYVAWYEEMLRITAPDGLIYACADFPVRTDRLPILGQPDSVSVSLPPGSSY